MQQGNCVDCGGPRGESPSRRTCQRCLSRDSGTRRSREMRAAVLRAYGGESPHCVCCGEQTREFLTLDHVNNGGRAHRRLKGNQGVYHELRRTGYPDSYRVLCFNCNLARGCYGRCPHAPALQDEPCPVSTINAGIPGSRICTGCKRGLAETEFYADKIGPRGLQSRCKVCTRAASIARLQLVRQAALMHYSRGDIRCRCCGEREQKFLALDHINGEGPRQPGRRGAGNSFYSWLKKQGFPPGLAVLCHNCNCAKGTNRECPHTLSR